MSFDFYMDAEEEWCYDTNPICDFPNLKNPCVFSLLIKLR